MAKASIKRLRMDDYEIKREDVRKILIHYREIREGLISKKYQDETRPEAAEEQDTSNIPSSDAEVDILGLSEEEKSDRESFVSIKGYNSQRSENTSSGSELAVHTCTYKGCDKSFKSPALLTQHAHNHTINELRKSFCGKPEETHATDKSRVCESDTSYDEDINVCDDDESGGESSVLKESHDSQKLKKTEPDAHELSDSSDDPSYKDEVGTSDEEYDGPGVSRVGQKSQKLKKVGATSSRNLTIHVCPYEDCDKFFSRPFRLTQHIRTHTGERPYVCPHESCSKSYSRQQHLKRHIEVSHQEKETTEAKKARTCVMCGLTLSNIYCLKKHLQRHHVSRQYECSECGRAFAKQQHLQRHTFEHTGIKPFPCDYPGCEMRCLTLSVLKRHNLIHQKSRYACPQETCQQKFDTYKDLQHHFVADHPKVCDICGSPFRQLRSLRKHRASHENTVQVYFCTYPACDRYYTQLNNLTAHIMQKHKEMKIYECGVCEKKLSTKQKLILHMTTHSPSYKRNYKSKNPRRPRKDKGCSRKDYARLLSGYDGPEEGEGVSHVLQSDIAKSSAGACKCSPISPNPQSKVSSGGENAGSGSMQEAEEIW